MTVNITNIDDNRVSKSDDNTILVTIKDQSALMLYIEYTAGDESALEITHSMRRSDDPTGDIFYEVIERDGLSKELKQFASKIVGDKNIVYPVVITSPSIHL